MAYLFDIHLLDMILFILSLDILCIHASIFFGPQNVLGTLVLGSHALSETVFKVCFRLASLCRHNTLFLRLQNVPKKRRLGKRSEFSEMLPR